MKKFYILVAFALTVVNGLGDMGDDWISRVGDWTGPSQSSGEDDRPPGKGMWYDVHDPSSHTSWLESVGHLPMWLQSSITVGLPLVQSLHLARFRPKSHQITLTAYEPGWDSDEKGDGEPGGASEGLDEGP